MGSKGINERPDKHLNYFYNTIVLLFLYQNDVNIYSGLVSLFMQFNIHSCEISLSTLQSQACSKTM